MDVYANGGGPVVTNLPFLIGTGAVSVPSGDYAFDVAPAGATIGDSVLNVGPVSLAAGESYTVVAFNEVADLGALLLTDLVNPISSSQIRLRAVHAAVGVGTVDILAVGPSGNTPLWTDVGFGAVGDAIDVPPGAYRVGLDVDNDGAPNLVASLPALPGGSYANVVATTDSVGAATLVVQLADGSTLNAPLLPFNDGGDALVGAYVGDQAGDVDFEFRAREFDANGWPSAVTEWFSIPAGIAMNASAGFFANASTTVTLQAGKYIPSSSIDLVDSLAQASRWLP